MKKAALAFIFLCISVLIGCSNGKTDPYSVKTFDITPEQQIEACQENDALVTIVTYYEMSDGTWKTDDYAYKYKLEISGRMPGAEKDSTFVCLSNLENITFEQAWKASGLSSNLDDYFDETEAKLVAMK